MRNARADSALLGSNRPWTGVHQLEQASARVHGALKGLGVKGLGFGPR